MMHAASSRAKAMQADAARDPLAPSDDLRALVPSHVPPHLVVDFDIYDVPAHPSGDVQLSWTCLYGRGPLVYTPHNGGHWIAASGVDTAAIFRNADLFSSASVSVPDHGGERLLPIESDGAAHAQYRRNVLRLFAPAEVARIEPEIRALAIRLIEGLRPRGQCEFIADFAQQLPLIVFLRLMGLPQEDRTHLHHLTETFTRDPGVPAKQEAFAALEAYIEGHIADRRAHPGDDPISRIILSEIDGRPYTHREIVNSVVMLLLGGLDTVSGSLGFFMRFLADHPEARTHIRAHRDNLAPIVQELLRRFAIPALGRCVSRDDNYQGIALKRGDRVLLVTGLFGMDPEIFANPDTVDFTRPPRHIGFGTGTHSCAGAGLARVEFTLFLREWLDRIPDFEIKPGTRPVMKAAPTNTVESLWLSWDVTPGGSVVQGAA